MTNDEWQVATCGFLLARSARGRSDTGGEREDSPRAETPTSCTCDGGRSPVARFLGVAEGVAVAALVTGERLAGPRPAIQNPRHHCCQVRDLGIMASDQISTPTI